MTSRRASSNTMFLWKMQSNTNFMQIKMESHELFATLCLLSSLFDTRDFFEIWMSLSFYCHRIVGIVFHSFVITLVESYLNSKSFVKISLICCFFMILCHSLLLQTKISNWQIIFIINISIKMKWASRVKGDYILLKIEYSV